MIAHRISHTHTHTYMHTRAHTHTHTHTHTHVHTTHGHTCTYTLSMDVTPCLSVLTQSRQTYDDLRSCEKKARMRYLTHEGQEKYWQSTDVSKGSTSPLMHSHTRPNPPTPTSAMNGVTKEQEPLTPRKSALEKDNEEVAVTEARAKRIGYQVSTV